jgi:hypothetical protein
LQLLTFSYSTKNIFMQRKKKMKVKQNHLVRLKLKLNKINYNYKNIVVKIEKLAHMPRLILVHSLFHSVL